MAVVETRELTKSYGALRALDGVSFSVAAGELFALVGPDGAGKSTTIRLLCGILQPDGGSAQVLGFDTVRERSQVVRRIGYLSQRFTLYGDLTVDENIAFFARIHGVRDYAARREELLAFTHLTDARARMADKLSGGMKQKLALACTLIHQPEIIFLDEPTTGVDPVSRRDFWQILSTLLHQGITVFMSTPYLDEAERCTRVALVHRGHILDIGSPAQIKAKMAEEVFEIVCHPVREAYHVLRGNPLVREVQMYGDRLNVILARDGDALGAMVRTLGARGVEIVSTRRVPPRLENVFMSIMTRLEEAAPAQP